MKAADAIEILKRHPESPIEIYLDGDCVAVEAIEVHAWGDSPGAPTPREFFVIPVERGRRTTGRVLDGGDPIFRVPRIAP